MPDVGIGQDRQAVYKKNLAEYGMNLIPLLCDAIVGPTPTRDQYRTSCNFRLLSKNGNSSQYNILFKDVKGTGRSNIEYNTNIKTLHYRVVQDPEIFSDNFFR